VLLNRYCPWFYSTAPVFTARTTHRSCVQCGECGTDTILPLQHPQQTPASESLSFTLSNIQIQRFTLPGNRCREPHVRLLEPSSAAPLPPPMFQHPFFFARLSPSGGTCPWRFCPAVQ
jgi:hypothetical protein